MTTNDIIEKSSHDIGKVESLKVNQGDEVKTDNGIPIAPDGGWGWIIVVVSFICCAVVDGMCSVFGVLLPYLVIYFDETMYKTALAGSVLAGGFLLSGMFLLLNTLRYGSLL